MLPPSFFSFKRIIPFYIVSELLPPIILSFFILFILVFCQQVSRNSEIILSPVFNWKIISQIFLCIIPPIITFVVPTAISIGSIIALARLSADSEWVAIEASLVPRLSKLGPFLYMGIGGFLIILWLNWTIAPSALNKLRLVRDLASLAKASSLVRPQVFISQYPNHLLRIRSIDPATGKWQGVVLLKKEEKTGKIQLIAAKNGDIKPVKDNLQLFEVKLSNGIFIDNLLSDQNHVTSAFTENTIRVGATPQERGSLPTLSDSSSPIQLSSLPDLFGRIDPSSIFERNKDNPTLEAAIEIHKRLAFAFAALFAALCVTLLATKLRPKQPQRSLHVVLSFILLILYYGTLTFTQSLILKGKMTLIIGAIIGLGFPIAALFIISSCISNKKIANAFYYLQPRKHQPGSVIYPFAESRKDKLIAENNETLAITTIPILNLGHYILFSEFTKYLLSCVSLLTLTILLFTYLDIAPVLSKNNIQVSYAINYLLMLAPQLVYYVTPFAVIVAVTAGATTLARSGQLTILAYYSNNPLKLVWPIIIFTCTILGALLLLADSILPYTNRDQDYKYRTIKGKSIEEVTIAFDRQWLADENTGYIYGYRVIPTDDGLTKHLNAIILKQTNPEYYLEEVAYFEDVNSEPPSPFATSKLSFAYKIDNKGVASFEERNYQNLPDALKQPQTLIKSHFQDASKLTNSQLKEYIKQLTIIGLPTTALEMDLLQKKAFPFSCITLLVLSFPICLILMRRQYQSRFIIVIVAIAVSLIFWAILTIFEAAGKSGAIPIYVAAWSPHALFLALSSFIHLKLHH